MTSRPLWTSLAQQVDPVAGHITGKLTPSGRPTRGHCRPYPLVGDAAGGEVESASVAGGLAR
jgi:hypothetical protein